MLYRSTRGKRALNPVDFETALLTGLAPDGGLYVPVQWPTFHFDEIADFVDAEFSDVAARVLQPFVGDIFSKDALLSLCKGAYSSFTHEAKVPLRQISDEDWLLELYHGPTLAFKDVAMQLLGRLFEEMLTRRNRKITIIGATSGDTGGAAIEALAGRKNIQVFILHPKGRISEVQRRLMTSSRADNIYNLAIEGTFDDCQALVKDLFADHQFVHDVQLGGVNSINWARIAIQTVYYFTSAAALGAPSQEISYVVPTGNFGDIFAGFVARKMGLPIRHLCAATNQNNIIHRVLETGHYKPSKVVATTSPSMDIQVASNFERLIYDASGGDEGFVNHLMKSFAKNGEFTLSPALHHKIKKVFLSDFASEDETAQMMKAHYQETEELIDPHSAVGCVVTQKLRDKDQLKGSVVTLATAHPAKFPGAVKAATGIYPQLPEHLGDLLQRPENITECTADLSVIKDFICDQLAA